MEAFDIVVALLSFVYALALTHLYQTATDLIVARRRVVFSWSYTAWMALVLVSLVNNWLALIPARIMPWSMALILLQFAISSVQYFTCSLMAVHVREEGAVDLRAFMRDESRPAQIAYLAMSLVLLPTNFIFERQSGRFTGTALQWLSGQGMFAGLTLALLAALWLRAAWFQVAVPLALCAFMIWTLLR